MEWGTTVTLSLLHHHHHHQKEEEGEEDSSEITHDEARRIEEFWEGTSGRADKVLDEYRPKSCSYPCYVMRTRGATAEDGQRVVGLAVFDRGELVGDVVCFLVASLQRPRSSPLHGYGMVLVFFLFLFFLFVVMGELRNGTDRIPPPTPPHPHHHHGLGYMYVTDKSLARDAKLRLQEHHRVKWERRAIRSVSGSPPPCFFGFVFGVGARASHF